MRAAKSAVSSLIAVIAGLDPAIHAAFSKLQTCGEALPCRNSAWIRQARMTSYVAQIERSEIRGWAVGLDRRSPDCACAIRAILAIPPYGLNSYGFDFGKLTRRRDFFVEKCDPFF